MSLTLIAELLTHQAWADAELLRAVGAHPNSCSDEKLIATIQHIIVVQRVFASMLTPNPFDIQADSKPVESVSALQQRSVASHTILLSFVNGLTLETLNHEVANPRIPDLVSTVGETLMQVILHSQNHRGQCLMRLRELTGRAPTLDFIMWVKLGRPHPVHTAGTGE